MDSHLPLSMDNTPALEKTTKYVYAEHGSCLQKAFYTAWTNKEYCDITLRVGRDSIQTHRLILTSLSEYFKTLLHMDVNGKKDEAELHEVEFDSLCQILSFGYTGKIEISMENVAALFIASSYLQVVFVKDSCEKFLLDNMDKDNCIRAWCLADQYTALALGKKAVQMFSQEFEYISSTEDFTGMLTVRMFQGMLEQEGLVISKDGVILPPAGQEILLLKGILHYINRTNCCIEDAVSLLKAVRLPLIDCALVSEYLSMYPKIYQNETVQSLMDTMKTFEKSSKPSQETNRNWLSPRRPKINGLRYNSMTYGVGGEDGVHFFLRSHFGIPRPSKEAFVTSVDVHLRFWSQHPLKDPIVGGLTFKYSDNTVLQGGLPADSQYCSKVESFVLEDCEYITKVVMKTGWMIDNIKFETNFGKSYGPWGGTGGSERICVAPYGTVGILHSFAGIDINSGGSSAVHRVRLGWATLDNTEEELDMNDLDRNMRLRPQSDDEDEDEIYVDTDSDQYENPSDIE
ncbi:actin-binding protein IPP-like [Ylistrum balloti]|uniref:actin-binding protein IPP-like n=1 Tax=Ylistrum balloti TaxID=509963 RepID=UPI002905F70E|nr:actin-binding protein IPP-like [Ylistrum balloti]